MWNYLVYGGIFLGTFAYAVYKVQFLLIYASHMPPGARKTVEKPSAYDMMFREESVFSADGTQIQTYIIPALSKDIQTNKTVLMLGPNAGNMGYSLPIAQVLYKEGYNVVMMDYRGYGKSSGNSSEKGLKMDAEAVIRFIREDPQLANTKLVLYGRSLGGAVTVHCATANLPQKIDGIILENTFLSINKVVPYIFPPLRFFAGVVTESWRSEDAITKTPEDMPVLFLAGLKDEIIPPAHFKKLYELCPSTCKVFKAFPNGMHNDTIIQKGYFEDMLEFLNSI